MAVQVFKVSTFLHGTQVSLSYQVHKSSLLSWRTLVSPQPPVLLLQDQCQYQCWCCPSAPGDFKWSLAIKISEVNPLHVQSVQSLIWSVWCYLVKTRNCEVFFCDGLVYSTYSYSYILRTYFLPRLCKANIIQLNSRRIRYEYRLSHVPYPGFSRAFSVLKINSDIVFR